MKTSEIIKKKKAEICEKKYQLITECMKIIPDHKVASISFLASVAEFYENNGFLTQKQIDAVDKTLHELGKYHRPIYSDSSLF